MAETTLLRQSAIVRNASVGTSPPSPPRGPVKMGELPLVQVKMGPGGPQVLTPQQKPVEILPPRDAESALRTGGLPMVHVKMTHQGAQLDDGQDKPVVILPPKDQKHAVTTGGLPMVQMKRAQAGLPVQTLPNVKGGPPQIQGPQPALSQQRVVRVAAPKVPLPEVPEFPADQLMLCRYLLGKYLTDLRPAVPVEGTGPVEGSSTADPGTVLTINLTEATISTVDQALVAVAVRAEAEAAGTAPEVQESLPVSVPAFPTPPTSIIPAAPTASYVAGRVGDRPHGYAGGRVQRNAAMAPRRVPRPGALPPVIVKMEGGRSVVQNQAEVAAVRAAVASQGVYVPEATPSESPDGNTQG